MTDRLQMQPMLAVIERSGATPWTYEPTTVTLEDGVMDCLVFLHNTRGRFPSYNVIDWLSPELRESVRAEAERRAEEAS